MIKPPPFSPATYTQKIPGHILTTPSLAKAALGPTPSSIPAPGFLHCSPPLPHLGGHGTGQDGPVTQVSSMIEVRGGHKSEVPGALGRTEV